MRQSTWKCPTCQKWTPEPISMRCSACKPLFAARVVVEEPEEVEAPVVAPVIAEPVKAAVAAKGGCAVCGKRHWSVATYQRRIAEGKTILDPVAVAWFEQHGAPVPAVAAAEVVQ